MTAPTSREDSPNSVKKRGRTGWDYELDKGRVRNECSKIDLLFILQDEENKARKRLRQVWR